MIIVKVGGAAGTEVEALIEDMVGREDIILVHGGSDEMNRLSEGIGQPPRFVTSPSGHTSRFTDEATLDLVRMTYSGKVNKRLVEGMRARGIDALGLSGVDGGLLRGRRKGSVRYVENGRVKLLRGDNTGTVEEVNTGLLGLLIDAGYVPVVTIPILAEDGGALNADADRVAAAIAIALGADSLVLLTNQRGLLRDPGDPNSLVEKVTQGTYEDCMGYAQGRMKKKVMAAMDAVKGGVGRVVIGNVNIQAPLTRALEGEGTLVC